MTALIPAAGLAVDLPPGWWCVQPGDSDRVDELCRVALGGADPRIAPAVRAAAAQLRSAGAGCMLLRPALDGDGVPITGGVFVGPPFHPSGAALHAVLEQQGEAAALANLEDVPVVSVIRRVPVPEAHTLPLVQVTYLVCADVAGVVLAFSAGGQVEPSRLVGELAQVVSRARVVR
jgi:hypothetical protein